MPSIATEELPTVTSVTSPGAPVTLSDPHGIKFVM